METNPIAGINSFANRFAKLFAINRAVLFAVAGKVWSMGAGLLTTLLIASFFSPELQGYYYTFFSVLAFQVFAELGLTTVITSYASHEWTRLQIGADGLVTGDPEALSRLSSLAQFALKWFAVAASCMTIILAFGGLFFFKQSATSAALSWQGPWLALCLFTGINLCLLPVWALLEGCNQVDNVYRFRFAQAVASSALGWLAIYLGAGLWAAAVIAAANLMVTLVTIGTHYRNFIVSLLSSTVSGPRFHWVEDILPMQWRVSLSWLSGYFSFSLFTPVLFHYHGPVVAGQMGMTWAFISALTGVAASWITPNAPRLGMLVAQRKYTELDHLFKHLTTIVIIIGCFGAAAIWGGIFTLNVLHNSYATRLLSPAATACFLVATVILIAGLPISAYLRAHRKEPLLFLSVLNGILTGLAVFFLGKLYSAIGMSIGYLLVMALVTPFSILVWQRCRTNWHC